MIDFEKLEKKLNNADEATKRSILNELSDVTDVRAKKILEVLVHDKNSAIKLLASSYLKKNFSEPQQFENNEVIINKSSDVTFKTTSFNKNKNENVNLIQDYLQLFNNIDFIKYVIAPLGFIILLGLFSPVIPAFFFFIGYLFLIVSISVFYDKHIAIPIIAIVCLVSMLLYAIGFIVNFRPTFLLMVTFIGIGSFISTITTQLREQNLNSRATIEDLKTQIVQYKKLVEKKKDFEEAQKDMDMITKMKNELGIKMRRLGEVLIQIHELISNQKTEEIVERVIKLLTRQFSIKSISVWVLNKKFRSVYPLGCSEKHIDPIRYMNINIPLDEETIITKAVLEGGFYSAEDIKQISQHTKFSDEFNIKSEFIVSMDAGNQVIGVINCEEIGEGFELNDENKRLIKLISDVTAWALKNAGDLELSKRDLQNIKQLSEKEREEKKKIRSIFDKFVSPKVIEEIMNNPSSLALGGKRRKITIFFADIRGFTSMSENLASYPEVVLEIVNKFHSAMTDIIIAKNGTIDKYIGDALMALFGAPISNDIKEDAYNAIAAAVAIRNECFKIREALIKEGKAAVNLGIGLNTGEVVVGMVGSTKMMNYTAIGDAVNLAARLEANAQAGQILISRATYELVKDRIKVKTLDPIMVKGKREPVEIFEVIDVC